MKTMQRRNLGRRLVGAVVGAVGGFVVALNLMIASGAEEGYAASIGEAFDANPIAGGLAIVALIAGPFVGVAVARRSEAKPNR